MGTKSKELELCIILFKPALDLNPFFLSVNKNFIAKEKKFSTQEVYGTREVQIKQYKNLRNPKQNKTTLQKS
jgi:hypothetical protein